MVKVQHISRTVGLIATSCFYTYGIVCRTLPFVTKCGGTITAFLAELKYFQVLT
jgi:hypothetical protein